MTPLSSEVNGILLCPRLYQRAKRTVSLVPVIIVIFSRVILIWLSSHWPCAPIWVNGTSRVPVVSSRNRRREVSQGPHAGPLMTLGYPSSLDSILMLEKHVLSDQAMVRPECALDCDIHQYPWPFFERQISSFQQYQLKQLIYSDRNTSINRLSCPVFCDQIMLLTSFSFCQEAKQSLTIENAGGKSQISEALSIHYFVTTLSATDVVYECQIEYWYQSKMVDFLCTIHGQRVGVSVTRAMHHFDPDRFTHEDGYNLLNKKLYGLIVSRNTLSERHSFYKSVLHIWCQTQRIANILENVYSTMDLSETGMDIRGTLILLLTTCTHDGVYHNKALV